MVEEDSIVLEESLVEQGIIDSFGIIEISTFMQKEFKISVNGNEMNRTNFGSVSKMVAFIEKKLLSIPERHSTVVAMPLIESEDGQI
jgi:acyl carrier protein